MAEEGDHAAGSRHLDRDRHQGEKCGGDRPVDDQQHHPDHPEGERGDLDVAALADRELVGDQSRRPAHVGLDPGWPWSGVDDLADGGDGFVGHAAAGVADQIHLDQGGFAVAALRPRRGEWVTPEVLDVLNVLGVGLHLCDQHVGERVGVGAQRLLAFEDEGDEAVGVVLAEHRPDPLGRDQRRRVLGALGDVVDPPDLFQRWDQGVARGGQRQPEDRHRDGEHADKTREALRGVGGGAHPDLSRQ